jgi:hypothetical protein
MAFDSWAVLELMGHRQRIGYMREVEIAGSPMLRIDILMAKDQAGQDVTTTEYYAMSAVYAIRPCTEDVARTEALRYGEDLRPLRPLDFREREKPGQWVLALEETPVEF